MKLRSLQLKTQQSEKAIDFYTTNFGMTLEDNFENEEQSLAVLRLPNSRFYLELIYNKQNSIPSDYQQEAADNYWKYSLFVKNIEQAYRFLKNKDIITSDPYQFEDIGYLMHTKDDENYQIEFIQQTFKQNTPMYASKSDSPSNIGLPVLGLITLRTKDPVKSIQFFETFLDMKLLVRMYVKHGQGFTLYFLGRKDLVPPNNNIDAVENREWLYQQQASFIELQHYWGSEYQEEFELISKEKENMGFRAMKFKSENLNKVKKLFTDMNLNYTSLVNNLKQQEEIQIYSPDKQLVVIE